MNGHDEYLELLAASIDFGLTEEEVARLNYHLASCPECRRAATELRGQAAAIATTPIAPLAPARSEQILRAALRKPAARPRWGMLAVAALLATLAGGVALAGLRLVDNDPAPSEPPPSQVAEASAPPSEAPVEESADPGAPPPDEGPRVTPNPGDDEPPDTGSRRARVPAAVHARLSGRSASRPPPTTGCGCRSRDSVTPSLALLDADGRPSAGLADRSPFAEDCVPLAASRRQRAAALLLQRRGDPEPASTACDEQRVFAYPRSGDELRWLPGHASERDQHLLSTDAPSRRNGSGDRRHRERTTRSSPNSASSASARLVTVGGRWSSVTEALEIAAPLTCCTIGPDGVAYGSSSVGRARDWRPGPSSSPSTQNGMRPGWPIVVDGTASAPVVRPERPARLLVLDRRGVTDRPPEPGRIRGGAIRSTSAVTIDVGPGRRRPAAAARRRARACLGRRRGRDPRVRCRRRALDGFPYEPETAFLERGNDCGPE